MKLFVCVIVAYISCLGALKAEGLKANPWKNHTADRASAVSTEISSTSQNQQAEQQISTDDNTAEAPQKGLNANPWKNAENRLNSVKYSEDDSPSFSAPAVNPAVAAAARQQAAQRAYVRSGGMGHKYGVVRSEPKNSGKSNIFGDLFSDSASKSASPAKSSVSSTPSMPDFDEMAEQGAKSVNNKIDTATGYIKGKFNSFKKSLGIDKLMQKIK